MINELTIGTRGSALAIAQTQIVVRALKIKFPSIKFNVATIKTKGDIDKRPLFTIDRKGIFEKEINNAVIRNDIDVAVHSLKDVPSDLPNILNIASVPKRSKPNDVLVSHTKNKLKYLQSGSIIGTSSLRRAVQLIRLRPDLNVKPIRGNVETRIRKTFTGGYDAIVLAEAGLTRLGLEDTISERFALEDFIPAPGQGALAVICRTNNQELIELLKKIEDPQSRAEFEAEHSLLEQVEGGCRFPVGAVAVTTRGIASKNHSTRTIDVNNRKRCLSTYDSHHITLYVNIFSADGTKSIKLKKMGNIKNAKQLGVSMGHSLIKRGALDLARGWREAVTEWNRN